MRTIFVLFDTLNRHNLGPYGGVQVATPGFDRLAERAVTFDAHHVGSLPCMPARRDLHTGRLNFLHRSWGPLEPFDISLPQILRQSGVYSHLITDHYHYFEDGGAGYVGKYTSYDFLRGQEGDPWVVKIAPDSDTWRARYHPGQVSETRGSLRYHNLANRERIVETSDFPSTRCFDSGLAFLDDNRDADDWFLQIETFDPHEPFTAPPGFRDALPTGYDGPILDWPPYAPVSETPEEIAELRANYAALLAHCDAQLGRLLDRMDALNLWDDTMLIVTTDHGFLTGEHDWWAKIRMPAYAEIAHIPLFIHHPNHAAMAGQRRTALTQTIDIMPTVLSAHGCAVPASVRGRSLLPLMADETAPGHDAVIFGYFGGAVNLADGRHSYFRYPPTLHDPELYQYTLMPSHVTQPFSAAELAGATLTQGDAWTGGMPVLKVPVIRDSPWYRAHGPDRMIDSPSLIFDMANDPAQAAPLDDPALEARLAGKMAALMAQNHAPPEAFARLGLAPPSDV